MLAAVEEVLEENNMPSSPTAYFAALMNFAQGIDMATADEHVVGAVFRLLEIVFPRSA